MHEELFHSPDRPFRATPDARCYFAHDNIETARQTVVRAVQRAEGPVMVLGGAGLGKSILGMVVVDDLSQRFDVVTLNAARLCSRRALLQSILFELQLPYRDLSEGDLRLSILARLEPSDQHAPDGVLILVDEAHTLPAKLLDELRLITNFTRNHQPRARLVLIGSLRLEHTFAEPQMESFNQRLAARCYLQPMNRQQTSDYVRYQMTRAGLKPRELITDEAIQTVYAASEGVPRLTNQIMDHALVLAITRNQCPISAALVEEAWADLQQLPAPWHSGAERLTAGSQTENEANYAVATAGGIPVEFGSLDEDDDWGDMASPTPPAASKPTAVASVAGTAQPTSSRESLDIDSSDLTVGVFGESDDDSDDELRLADEPLGANPRSNSFFAAFVPSETDMDDEPTELDLMPELPRLMASATDGSSLARSSQLPVESEHRPQPFDRFFHNRPTDEQLLAFTDEQQAYDAMGVWENDPPLATSNFTGQQSQAEHGSSPVIRPVTQLFGDDFDEEVSLSPGERTDSRLSALQSTNNRSREVVPARTHKLSETQADVVGVDRLAEDSTTARTAQQAVEAADYVARIQQFADSVAANNRRVPGPPMPTVDELLAESYQQMDRAQEGSSLEPWSVDISTLDFQQEVAVHNQIEDIVSQLNFAAFAVEPYSVEQISIAARDHRVQPPEDSTRTGKNDEIYTMHRPRESSFESTLGTLQSDSAEAYDDDRALLVIEEDVPLQSRADEERERPATKLAPYSQLFANMRK